MTKAKKQAIINQVKADRAARRAVEIELGLNKVHAQVHATSKRDIKRSNTVRVWE